MTHFRTVLPTSGLILALLGGAVQAQPAAQPALNLPTVTVQIPAPDPVPVTLKAATTALLVFDVNENSCSRPECAAMLPTLTRFMANARKAGLVVGYGTREHNRGHWRPEIAPMPGDIYVENIAQDRFYSTNLDQQLKAKGITTLILAGVSANGSVTYTSVGATAHGYTVVVPVDTVVGTPVTRAVGLFQILNQDDRNSANEPLKPKTSTLSRTDLITFQ